MSEHFAGRKKQVPNEIHCHTLIGFAAPIFHASLRDNNEFGALHMMKDTKKMPMYGLQPAMYGHSRWLTRRICRFFRCGIRIGGLCFPARSCVSTQQAPEMAQENGLWRGGIAPKGRFHYEIGADC